MCCAGILVSNIRKITVFRGSWQNEREVEIAKVKVIKLKMFTKQNKLPHVLECTSLKVLLLCMYSLYNSIKTRTSFEGIWLNEREVKITKVKVKTFFSIDIAASRTNGM